MLLFEPKKKSTNFAAAQINDLWFAEHLAQLMINLFDNNSENKENTTSKDDTFPLQRS